MVVARTAGERSHLTESIGRACCFSSSSRCVKYYKQHWRSQRFAAAVITSKITFDHQSPEVHLAEPKLIC